MTYQHIDVFSSSPRSRRGAAIDLLVIFLALITLCFWIAGNIFLAYFPAASAQDATHTPTAVAIPDVGESALAATESEGPVPSLDPGKATSDLDDAQTPSGDGERQLKFETELKLAQESFESSFAQKIAQAESEWRVELETQSEKMTGQIKELQSAKELVDSKANKQAAVIAIQKETIDKLNSEISSLKSNITLETPALEIPMLKTNDEKITAPVFRNWRGNNNRVVEMAFIRWDNDNVVFVNKTNRFFIIPPSRLSSEDQQLVESFKRD